MTTASGEDDTVTDGSTEEAGKRSNHLDNIAGTLPTSDD